VIYAITIQPSIPRCLSTMVDTFGAASPEGSPVPVGGGAASGSRLEGAPQGRSDRSAPAGVSD